MEAPVVISLSNPSRMIDVRMHLGYLGILWNKVKVKGEGVGVLYGLEIFGFCVS